MKISFDIGAESLVQKIAAQGEMNTLVKAIVSEGYGAEFTAEQSADDLLNDMDNSDITCWVCDNLDPSDIYDADRILADLSDDEISDHIRDTWDCADVVALLDGHQHSDVLAKMGENHGSEFNNAVRDYAQENELLPAGNTASNADLLAELQRRLTDGSMEADDVLDTLTQSGRLVIRTVYHTK